MVQAWYLKPEDKIVEKKEPNHQDPPKYLDLDELKNKTGVVYWMVDADKLDTDDTLKNICNQRGYSYRDEVTISPEKLPDYENKLKSFYTEHLHSDEEVRYVIEGSGFFDVRDAEDKWVRIEIKKNDLITLPPGIYHRFTLDKDNYAKIMRLFVGEPVWKSYGRPSDDHPARKAYLELAKNGFKEFFN